jgi:hypothetical protein
MVPWPLMTCGWLYGGMSTAPVAACSLPAAPQYQLYMVVWGDVELRMPSTASQGSFMADLDLRHLCLTRVH